ncbi:hypothetical protein GPJ56_006582 [Histomonas meleagridis]|uniref:uncharacterized protein n=1 Tax=Histomonas meleagridis TaxID=135588 RepID=UPI003559A695|nr:hypothetical protein GPJ56_006582 [Histomonas meleagridis]KAH0798361.1 hypothetical protein GO595_008910 [Histomonas meleagridis]
MTQLNVASPEAKQAVDKSIEWMNMMVNQITPFVLKKIESCERLGNGHIKSKVILVTDCFQGKDFEFELVLDPSVNTPEGLLVHNQLN